MLPRRTLLLAAPFVLAGCNTASADELSRARSSPSPTAPPTPSTAPTKSPTPTPSSSESPAPPAPVKDLDWYLKQVPKFSGAPKPEPINVPDGETTPWWSRVPTSHRVAFITIDDGGMSRTNMARELIKRAKIPVTMFLNSPAAGNYTSYFKAIQATGASVQNHTVTHRNLKGQTYDFQRKEIEDCADRLEELFGKRPYLFRPPFGEYDAVTLKAARDSGMRVSFFWKETVNQGIVRYQTNSKVIRPGDVMLMHFRPALADDLIGALKAIKASGLTPARLEDYLLRPAA